MEQVPGVAPLYISSIRVGLFRLLRPGRSPMLCLKTSDGLIYDTADGKRLLVSRETLCERIPSLDLP